MNYVLFATLGLIAIIAVFRLLSDVSRRRNRPTIHEVADRIERHANGTEGPYDWDDFTSVQIADPHLDAVVRRCVELDVIVLPEQRSRELMKIVEELRREARSPTVA